MSGQIHKASKADIYDLISFYGRDKFDPTQLAFFRRCVSSASNIWAGFVDGQIVCFWALIPPSLLADSAYLWLYVTPEIAGNEFIFVRHSQRAVEEMLKHYSVIVGHAQVGNEKGKRWLRWLGASFGERQGELVPFVIRRGARG